MAKGADTFHSRSDGSSSVFSRRGFSLIEVLIVSAILAILAGIGLISYRWVMDNARRKATIAEARQISTAVEWAHQETGIFPKLNYLIEGLLPLTDTSGDGILYKPNPGDDFTLFNYFDYTDGITSSEADRYGVFNRRIRGSWEGPYWALSPTSRSSVEGPAGFIEMEIYQRGDESEGPGNDYTVRRWPMDQYGYPYSLYLLEYYDPDDTDPDTFNVRFLKDPLAEPSYACAVVSYGPDGYPGLLRDLANADELNRKIRQRMWVELFPHQRYRMLQPDDYILRKDPAAPSALDDAVRERIEAYSETEFSKVSGYTKDAAISYDLVGITDTLKISDGQPVTSDDIIIEF